LLANPRSGQLPRFPLYDRNARGRRGKTFSEQKWHHPFHPPAMRNGKKSCCKSVVRPLHTIS
jgi:hypothetical protein